MHSDLKRTALVQYVLTQVPVFSISRTLLKIFRRMWHWFRNLDYLYKDPNNKICFSESHHLRFKFPILKSCLKIKMLLQTYQNKQNTKCNIIWIHFSVCFLAKIYVDVRVHFDFFKQNIGAIYVTFQ